MLSSNAKAQMNSPLEKNLIMWPCHVTRQLTNPQGPHKFPSIRSIQIEVIVECYRAYCPSGHYNDYYSGGLSLIQVIASHLTHWGRVRHICVVKLIIIGSDNGLSPGWRQAIIWTNTEILLIGPLGTNFSEILIRIQTFSFKNVSSAKWCPFRLGLNVLKLEDP